MHTENETSGNDTSTPTAETPTDPKAAPTKKTTRPAKKAKVTKRRKPARIHRPKGKSKKGKTTKERRTTSTKQALPIVFERSAVVAIDAAWKKLGLDSRISLFRVAIGDYLKRKGQSKAAQAIRAAEGDAAEGGRGMSNRKARR
jgi:hypothetical protein